MAEWGGDWTEVKLGILRGYLQAYLTAMKGQRRRYRLGYIDGFAGAGYRRVARQTGDDLLGLGTSDAEAFRDGSARIALALNPGFDSYIFIEKDRAKCRELKALQPAHTGATVRVEPGDVNVVIQDLCKRNWSRRRAVVFLDPYGMQVDWTTLVSLSNTEAVDVWLLVPVGIGLLRMLARDLSAIPIRWQDRLDRMLGTPDWRDRFYTDRREIERRSGQQALFESNDDDSVQRIRTAKLADIADFYVDRLRTVFPAVAPTVRLLHNSRGLPLYMLCFAIANPSPRAQGIALNIAGHLLSQENQL